jgi:transcriptional regulator with XRE-family HTH domain
MSTNAVSVSVGRQIKGQGTAETSQSAKSLKMKIVLDTNSGASAQSPRASFCLPLKPDVPPTPARRKSQRGAQVSDNNGNASTIDLDREVIRCKVCGLVQYRTRTGNCRRCLRLMPPKVEFLIPPPAPPEIEAEQPGSEKWPNRETVENIGQRIRQLRESRAMTQSQLQARSRVSRSYLSRIESGQMTPSLGTLEKISEALGVGLNRFFIPESNGEALLEDPFIQGLRPFLRQLDWEQWQSILKRLQAISDNVTAMPLNIRPIGNPARLPQPQYTRRATQPSHHHGSMMSSHRQIVSDREIDYEF